MKKNNDDKKLPKMKGKLKYKGEDAPVLDKTTESPKIDELNPNEKPVIDSIGFKENSVEFFKKYAENIQNLKHKPQQKDILEEEKLIEKYIKEQENYNFEDKIQSNADRTQIRITQSMISLEMKALTNQGVFTIEELDEKVVVQVLLDSLRKQVKNKLFEDNEQVGFIIESREFQDFLEVIFKMVFDDMKNDNKEKKEPEQNNNDFYCTKEEFEFLKELKETNNIGTILKLTRGRYSLFPNLPPTNMTQQEFEKVKRVLKYEDKVAQLLEKFLKIIK